MPVRTDQRASRPLILAIFFLSGASGLIYEITWTRRLSHVFGSTTLAVATVLAAFMGGLALGSYRWGRRADRSADRALRLYGVLEIGVAAAATAVPLLLRAFEPLYLALAPPLESLPQLFFLAQFLLVGAVLVLPTFLMGGTLPVLSRWLVREAGDVEKRVSALYAANTLGAGAGTAAAIYVLLPTLGVRASEWVAVASNIAAGAIAIALDRRSRSARPSAAVDPAVPTEPAAPAVPAVLSAEALPVAQATTLEDPAPIPGIRWLLAGIALTGFAAMVDEVAWSRLLALVLGSSVYSFGMMLLVFLAGLAAGSALFARMPHGRAAAVFAVALAANTIAALIAIAYVPYLPTLFLTGFPAIRESFLLLQLWNLVLTSGLLLPSAILFGMAFPAAIAASTEHSATGAGVGRVTVANTLGTVVGAFAGGFVLIPHIGLRLTLTTAALATALAALLTAGLADRRRLVRAIRIAAPTALVLAFLVPAWPLALLVTGAGFYAPSYATPDALRAAARQSQLLFYKDGLATTLSVDQTGDYRYYRSNGKTDASTHPGDMANQLLLGHLPMLLHPDPKDVFILGLGTGVSAAAIARYPVRSIEIVDIEAAARDASRIFAAENRDVLSDTRVRLLVADGRNALLARRRTYDVILSDPSDVWVAGVGSLLTREFYTLARSRLNSQGLMVQWFHMHSLPPEELKLLVRTFQSVFPNTTLWRPNRGDVILLGSVSPLPWDYTRLVERVGKVPGVATDLQSLGLWDPLVVFAAFVLEGQDLKRMLADSPAIHTDDRPTLEYMSPRAVYVDTTTVNDAGVQGFQTVFIPPMTRFDPEKDVTPRAGYLLGFGHASLGRTDTAIRMMEDAIAREPGNAKYWIGIGNQYRVKDWRSKAAGAYRQALAITPGEPEAADDLAALLRADADDAGAETVLRDALKVSPQEPALLASLARLLLDNGRPAEAVSLLSPALAGRPKNADLPLLAGLAFEGTGNFREADRQLRIACALAPDNASILRAAGRALLLAGDLPEAATVCTRADILEPGNPETLATLAEIANRRGDAEAEARARSRAAPAAPAR